MKDMREMLKLMESVMAVPGLGEGSESDMQTAGTVGRNQDYAEFDAEQSPVMEKAPPGMEDVVMKLKNEYGHDKKGMEKAFATAWSIYNKKHGKKEEACSMEESVPAVDSCNQDNPADADVACAMEESADSETLQTAKNRFWEMCQYHVEPDAALERVEYELREMGVDETEIAEIRDEIVAEYGVEDSDGEPMGSHDMGDDADALASAGHGSDEDYGYYQDDNAYDLEEARPSDINTDEIRDITALPHEAAKARAQEILAASTTGDTKKAYLARQINATRNTMAVVKLLYDMVLKGEGHGVQGSSYSKKFDNAMEEAFDLQNGYDDVHDASGKDYFPTGADSPVVDKTGASGARQGDNPEQKKMQIAEVHKELVYSYRNFLKESSNQKKS